MRRRHAVLAVLVTVGALVALAVPSAGAAEYTSALKIRGIQYDAPGRDNNSCRGGNAHQEYLVIKNYSRTKTVNLRGHVVRDAAGNTFTFTRNHTLQPGDYVRLRGGHGTDSDAGNVVYRNRCTFVWNNDKDTIYLYLPSGARADVHSYTKRGSDPDGNGYVTIHG
ncbi:lamin tail domain-containing protein [Streptomyces sp. 3MP-14]|uniref:Lamin tail domain-containing protein n=1 Tax=Streptomyces mimosae TaxID=2586635 RepID=A0A5N6A4Q9_9ACTN|nr:MULTISPECIES: lamin tail domain-containing protein [Streptomyces]KAB8163774.1 lamin tail domain-containing protein [Streptomyces mimosae]KAB8175217.1 lamin tail domain-containing protein [Streptomyces sp. 3MP-14]